MAITSTMLLADFRSILADCTGITGKIKINGEDVDAVIGDPSAENMLMIGGDNASSQLTVIVAKEDTEVTERDPVIYNNIEYQVNKIQNYPMAPFLVLQCSTPDPSNIK